MPPEPQEAIRHPRATGCLQRPQEATTGHQEAPRSPRMLPGATGGHQEAPGASQEAHRRPPGGIRMPSGGHQEAHRRTPAGQRPPGCTQEPQGCLQRPPEPQQARRPPGTPRDTQRCVQNYRVDQRSSNHIYICIQIPNLYILKINRNSC